MVPQRSPEELIGKECDRRSGIVYRKEFQRWAASIGDFNPLYFDEVFARERGHRDVVMPPMFISQVVNGVDRIEDLRADGSSSGGWFGSLEVPGEQRMVGGSTYRFFESAYPDDEIECSEVLLNYEVKNGRSGRFALITWDRSYCNQLDSLVARAKDLVIVRGG